MKISVIVLCLLLITGCGTAAQPTATVPPVVTQETERGLDSAWGTVERVAQVEQIEALDFAFTATDRIATWTGVQDDLVRHFSQGISGQDYTLDLPTFYPQQQRILDTTQGALKVWLDRNNSEPGLRLQASTFDFEGRVSNGIIPINTRRTRNFDIVQTGTRDFRIVWSGGLGEITNLYLHQIDDEGRHTGGDLLRVDGDHPALLRDSEGVVHLFWLQDNGRRVFHAQFEEVGAPTLAEVRAITSNSLDVTGAILQFDAGFDGETVYLLWTIRRIDDSQFVMMSSGTLDGAFSTPEILTIDDGRTIEWGQVAQQTQSPLPIVAHDSEVLQLLWLAEGEITETEMVASTGGLISAPQLDTSPERLAVSWSVPTGEGYANLYYVERSRLP